MLRRDLIPDGFESLTKAMEFSNTSSKDRRLWIAVDFGRGDGAWLSAAPVWREFLTQAIRRSWIRLVIIGTTPSQFMDFHSILRTGETPFEDEGVGRVQL